MMLPIAMDDGGGVRGDDGDVARMPLGSQRQD